VIDMRRSGLALTLMIGLCGACGGSDEAVVMQYEISGRVIDAHTGNPIAKAEIDFRSDTLDHAETTSDANGHFQLDVDVSAGVMFGTISAAHVDYQTPAAESVYFDTLPHVLTLELQPKPASK
jgi:hypothetical protein